MHFYNLDEWELYDLKTDPGEMRSVFSDPAYAEIAERLRRELRRLQKHYAVPDDSGSVSSSGQRTTPKKQRRKQKSTDSGKTAGGSR